MHKLNSSHHSWLSPWREDLLRGSNKDPLVDLKSSTDKWMYVDVSEGRSIQVDLRIKKIIREQQEWFKNAGVNALCLIHDVLNWQDENHSYETPIFLSEVVYRWDKINQTITLSISEEQFLNPFLVKMFATNFDIELSLWLEQTDWPVAWSRKTVSILGNFHYHRFALLRDFDSLEAKTDFNESLLGFYMQEKVVNRMEPQFSPSPVIFPMDIDQCYVFCDIAVGNQLVVEGPPGSGKSQVLVNLLFHAASKHQSVVLCSEKRTALEVVETKLIHKGLGLFCQNLSSTKQGKTEFIRSLQTCWMALEKRVAQTINTVQELHFFEQQRDALALKLERLSNFPRLNTAHIHVPFTLSVYPDTADFKNYKGLLFQLNQTFKLLCNASLSVSCFVYLKPFVFSTQNSLEHLINLVKQHRESLLQCQATFGDKLALTTTLDLESMHRILIHAQILSQPMFRKNPDLFVLDSKVFKKFHSGYQRYLVSKQALDLHEQQEGFKWQNPWSHQELVAAKKSLSEDRFWKTDFRKWKKRFINSYQPEVFTRDLAVNAIDSCLGVHDVMVQHQKCLDEFHKLGIQHPEVDIPLILQLQRNVNQDYVGLKKTQEVFESDFLLDLLRQQHTLNDLMRFVNHHFVHLGQGAVLACFDAVIREVDFLSGQRMALSQLLSLEPKLPYFLSEIQDFEVLEDVVLWGAIEKFKSHNPELYHYTGADLMRDVVHLIQEEDRSFDQQIESFLRARVQQFNNFHTLITSPIVKLSEDEKALRKTLKAGRSILVKEFNKTRQHKSIHELLSSDAAPWIQLLKPILLLNPVTIAQVYPLSSGCIDLMLFDEASQIPFSHAIPAIFRAKQVAIFGDSQQLSPSSYFQQGSAQRSDLLSESRHFLPCAELNFHYRSRHESLIAFSNRYFYGNRLKVLPSCTDSSRDGVFCHFVERALYESGENRDEARALINQLNSDFQNFGSTETVGIVAFSEKQLTVLHNALDAWGSMPVLNASNQDRLTFSTVEKVQGDEFDALYISFGYAKDAAGNFALRFGPVNQEGGEKRLNVLFTRARRSLHFFHSVRAADFGHSENLGVQALKNFLLMHEHVSSKTETISENTLDVFDQFYEPHALASLMTLVRHAHWSGLQISLRFLKDSIETK